MIADDVKLDVDVDILYPDLVNLYGCTIGAGTRIGSFVEIQKDVVIGRNCFLEGTSFICEGVVIGDDVFIGAGVMFVNDLYPRATNKDGALQTKADWSLVETIVKSRVTIGARATILGGITIGEGARIVAGSVVTHDVRDGDTVAGAPARSVSS